MRTPGSRRSSKAAPGTVIPRSEQYGRRAPRDTNGPIGGSSPTRAGYPRCDRRAQNRRSRAPSLSSAAPERQARRHGHNPVLLEGERRQPRGSGRPLLERLEPATASIPRPHSAANVAVTPRSRQCSSRDHWSAATSITRPALRDRLGPCPGRSGSQSLRAIAVRSVALTRRLRAVAAQMKRSARAAGCRHAHNDGNQICVGLILVVIDLGFRVTFPSPSTATPALVIAPREIAAISAHRLSRSGERQVHRRIEAFDSFGVAARRVLPDALSLPNKSSILGSCHERSNDCSATPIRAGASPAERVPGHYRAPSEQSTQPLRRCCAALTGAKPAGTTDSPNSAHAAQLAHALRGAPVISDTAPVRHRHRRRPPGHTVLTSWGSN
jgi:hypothetical protein